MARRTSFISALATAHARSVRDAHAKPRHHVAQVRRVEQARAAAARADAAEQRAYEASIRAHAAAELRDAKAREREEREAERQSLREAKDECRATRDQLLRAGVLPDPPSATPGSHSALQLTIEPSRAMPSGS